MVQPGGKPCYLATDNGNSRLSRKADEVETLQLAMGVQLLAHARALLDEDKATSGELRFLARRLVEALTDVLRVAESRGGRLLVRGEQGADERNRADQRR
ncbi:hypothetical protein SVIO_051880 [Streptomyces violaceusniger]|uniref:Uncharacterized protein n=1 Tax=Streptomyces violaceusniger TaxID=68280 RepID=A0A4D4L040_STRVO|nr:hypothetical protein SVIO_051880 [Streptomyces violaceusniger]